MRRLLVSSVASLVLLAGALPQAQQTSQQPGQPIARDRQQQPLPPGTATLRGRVFAADTGQPLRKAQVQLNLSLAGPLPPNAPPENRQTTTDVDGRYEFRELRAGRYNLRAQKGSYLGLQWGQQRLNDPGKPIDILEGQTVEKVDFSLPRGGVITGRVLDEFGDPISDVQVAAVRLQSIGGTRRLMPAGRAAPSNDIGEFRLFALPPGEYYVSATYRNSLNPTIQSDDRSGYAPTYYPGTPDISTAQKITVGLGQTIPEITVPLVVSRTVRVSGTATDSQGKPLQGTVLARVKSAGGAVSLIALGGPTVGGPVRPDGSFSIANLTAGEYTLDVTGPFSNGPDAEFASTDVTVGSADVTGVRITTTKPVTISGRIVTGADMRALKPSSFRIGAFPDVTGGPIFGPIPQPSPVADDWTFQTKSRTGAVRLNIQGMPAPWSVKTIRYRGTDVTDSGLEVRAGEDLSDLEIELTDRRTDLSGTVTNARGETVLDYWVVLFARDSSRWRPPSRYVRVTRPAQGGRFSAAGLPPGEYLALAAEVLDPGEVTDPEFLARIQNRATGFSLSEGETKTVDLKLNAVQ